MPAGQQMRARGRRSMLPCSKGSHARVSANQAETEQALDNEEDRHENIQNAREDQNEYPEHERKQRTNMRRGDEHRATPFVLRQPSVNLRMSHVVATVSASSFRCPGIRPMCPPSAKMRASFGLPCSIAK